MSEPWMTDKTPKVLGLRVAHIDSAKLLKMRSGSKRPKIPKTFHRLDPSTTEMHQCA